MFLPLLQRKRWKDCSSLHWILTQGTNKIKIIDFQFYAI